MSTNRSPHREGWRSTTIVGLIHKGRAAIAGDGQVSYYDVIAKQGAVKIRALYEGRVLAGFAGAAADALTLYDRFEQHIETAAGSLPRASAEFAREWRSDRVLRRLDAVLGVLDTEHALIISGTGDIVEPDDRIITLGTGAPYALAAARAFQQSSRLSASAIAKRSIEIAADVCVFTNKQITLLELGRG
ncbi:MAG: HslU--HslV peptidase proteolytic subunit [Gemmatimonadetes bacterium]|nr:HslU--HslV peptidase proteolytic subunit [Gemmatimonadota bacterium]